jgi:SAM-dependent methyltransferase
MPGAHEIAWRYIFDWAVAGDALKCAPGDWIEFGSGPSYASEWFNRLGYHTVALDLEHEILTFAHERMTLDQRVDAKRSRFVAGDGQRLPFASAAFDGVICLNALHHIPDYATALSEIMRVLKPGCRAVFSEPGNRHADSPESKMVREQYGAVEKNIVLGEIHQLAQRAGFEQMILKPCVYPYETDLDFKQLKNYRAGHLTLPYTRPAQIADFLEQTHSIFTLTAPGKRPLTSARPGLLRAELKLSPLPTRAQPGEAIHLAATVKNTGDTLWLGAPREWGGYVTFGVKLCLPDGRLVSDTLGRTLLDRDVSPGSQITIQVSFQLPITLALGTYLLRFDMVDELVMWFEQAGSPVIEQQIWVGEQGAEPQSKAEEQVYPNLTQLAGKALAEMGVAEPSEQLLEPLARVIYGLTCAETLQCDVSTQVKLTL